MTAGTNSKQWDWMHSSQSADYFGEKKKNFIDKHFYKRTYIYNRSFCDLKVRRYRGLPLALALSLIYPVERISVAMEQIIKGLGNLARAADKKDKAIAKKGCKQLLLMPTNVLRAALLPLHLFVNALILTPAALCDESLASMFFSMNCPSRNESPFDILPFND